MKVGGIFRKWSPEECVTAAHVFAAATAKGAARQDACIAVGRAIGRSLDGVSNRLTNYGPTFADLTFRGDNPPKPRWPVRRRRRKWTEERNSPPSRMGLAPLDRIYIPDRVAADRDRRAGLDHESLTAQFFGDPLPGYSALDRARTS